MLQQFQFLQFSYETTESPNRRRQRNGWIKVAEPVGSNVAEGRPVGVIEENGEQVWRVHALGGLTVTESDAGSVRVFGYLKN